MNVKNVPNIPGSPILSALLKVGVIGGLGVYGMANSIYNVEGGHRAIMFNRLTGIKNKVCLRFHGFVSVLVSLNQ